MSTVYYPSIYDNTYKYAELANNSIVITTQTGYGAVAAAENTVIICDENGQWVTSSLDNYATSSDINDLQNSINTLQTDLTTISNNVQILSEDIIWMWWNADMDNSDYFITLADKYSNFLQKSETINLHGVYKLYGTVTLYISDITKMTPKVEGMTPVNWIGSLPFFEIKIKKDNPVNTTFVISEIIDTNNSIVTIPINAIFEEDNDDVYIQSEMWSGNWNNINITKNDFYIYSYNLYLERINRAISREEPPY